jgi:Fic family protein
MTTIINTTYSVPEYNIEDELGENLSNIEKVIDDLNKRRDSGLSPEFQHNLNRQLIVSQVYHSNAIEGNQLTLRETEIILNGMVINERPLKDELEAQSLSNATEYLYDIIAGSEPLNKRTFLELHRLILEKSNPAEAGKLRTRDVSIKNSEHIPPSFLQVEENLDELFIWVNRYAHKFHPLVMSAIVHHWLTWVHPFIDGNGRVARLFLNFFLLQKGYPEIIIKISDRDRYYDALVESDKKDITMLIGLIADKTRESVDKIEEFINEEQRQKQWKNRYSENFSPIYEETKGKYRFRYEVWRNQLDIFKIQFAEIVGDIQESLPFIEFLLEDYEEISLNKYIDLLEGNKVTNDWYLRFRCFYKEQNKAITIIFTAKHFAIKKPFKLLGQEVIDRKTGKPKYREFYPEVKLYISARVLSRKQSLDPNIDLVTVGIQKDKLVFGVRSGEDRKVRTEQFSTPRTIMHFIDQVLQHYLGIALEEDI